MTLSRSVLSFPGSKQMLEAFSGRHRKVSGDISGLMMILDQYGLQLQKQPVYLTRDTRNQLVLLPTTIGKKVLKYYRTDWNIETVMHEHSILEHLAQTGFSAPHVVKNRLGGTLVKAGEQYVALLDYIDGTNYASRYLPNRQRRRLIVESGAILAGFHRSLEGFLPAGEHHLGFPGYTGERRRDLQWHLSMLEELQCCDIQPSLSKADLDILEMLARRGEEISQRLISLEKALGTVDLRRLVIHGDFGLHNLLFHPDGTATLLDYELSRLEWRLSDLVITLPRLEAHNQTDFLKAYHAEFPLSPEEWHYLPEVWQLRMLQGVVQYWNNYYELGNSRRLMGARQRLEQADWAASNRAEFLKLRCAAARDASERPVRVWMVPRLFYPWVGGAERQAHKLALELLNKDVYAEIVTGWWFRGTPRREVLEGVPVYRNQTLWEFFGIKGLRKLGGYLYILTLAWYLGRRREEYDVLHIHGLNYHTYAAVVSRPWHRHNVLVKLANSGPASDLKKMHRGQQLALTRLMIPTALKCDRFIALNHSIREELEEAGVPADRISELGNGVQVSREFVKTDYSLHTPVKLIYVGRLHEQKGLDVLLTAYRDLLQEFPPNSVSLQLLGEGPLRETLVLLAESLGIASQVQFMGHVENVLDYLREADIFILPSRAEGISNALLEAMAVGLPVLVSDIPGNHDVVEHKKNGLLFDSGDAGGLRMHLLSLMKDTNLRQELGEAAVHCVESRFSIAAVAGRYIELYHQLVNGVR